MKPNQYKKYSGIKLTEQQFIQRVKKFHGNKYDCSKVIYINNQTKVSITCLEHGVFKIRPSRIPYSGCPKCGKIKASKSIRKYKTLQYFDKINTEKKAYAFGFFWADGYIRHNKEFVLELNENDINILKKLKQYFGGIICKRARFDKRTGKTYRLALLSICDIQFISSLKNSNFRINLEKIPHNLIRHFLRGLIDGDGHYCIKHGVTFSDIVLTSNIEDNFSWLTSYIKIPYYMSNDNSCNRLTLKGGHKVLEKFIKWLYDNSTISLKRKKEKIFNTIYNRKTIINFFNFFNRTRIPFKDVYKHKHENITELPLRWKMCINFLLKNNWILKKDLKFLKLKTA